MELFFDYESNISSTEDIVVIPPWETKESEIIVSVFDGNERPDALLEVDTRFQSNPNIMRIQSNPQITHSFVYTIPAEKIPQPNGTLRITFYVKGRITQPISFSHRIINLVFVEDFAYFAQRYFFGNDFKDEYLWFYPITPDNVKLTILTYNQSVKPLANSVNAPIPQSQQFGYYWNILPNNIMQVIEFEEEYAKRFESSATFFIGILLGICLEVIINYLWDRDETKR